MSAFLKSYFPISKGVSLAKGLALEIAERASAAAGLGKLWADTFKTNAGIYAAGSADYTYRGSANFDVIKTTAALILTPVMTSNSAPSGNVYRDSASAANYEGYKAFAQDSGGAAERWSTTSSAFPHWLCYKFATAKTIEKYKLFYDADRGPKDWKLQGSNNTTNGSDGDWTDIDTVTGENPVALTEYTVDTPGSYTAYRILITKNTANETATGYLYIAELELYPAAPTTASIVSVRSLDLAVDVTQIMLFADVTLGTGTAAYYVSTDDGTNWTAVVPETLANVPAGKQIRIKVELTGNAELEFGGVAA